MGYELYKNSNDAIDSLLLKYDEDKVLKHASKAGTGFNDELRKELYKKLSKVQVDTYPCNEKHIPTAVCWVKPKYVAEMAFTEWAQMHRLRYPCYKSLRNDKPTKKVIKENVE